MKKDRHTRVEVVCATCGNAFEARKERVDKGLGRFCSKKCFDIEQVNRRKPLYGRKDLATKYKTGNRYSARWYDEEGKTKSTSYPKWWWEVNVGEIPKGMIVMYKDGNPMNTDPSNFELGTRSAALVRGNQTRKKDIASYSEYRNKQSQMMQAKWKSGIFKHLWGAFSLLSNSINLH